MPNSTQVSCYIANEGVHDSDRLRELQSLSLSEKIAITQARIIEWFQFWEGNVYLSFSGGKDSTVLLDIIIKTLKAIDPTFELPIVFSNTGLEYPEIQKFARSKNATFVTPKMNFVEVIKTYGYPLISKEVASAIYYARRIKPYNENNKNAVGCDTHTDRFKTSDRKRSELLDRRIDNCTTAQTHVVQENYRRKQLLGTLGSYDDVKVKSKFNKKKWLPLAQELPALISHKCCDVMKKSPIGIYQRATHNKPYLGTMADESLMRRQSWIRTGCNAFEGKKPSSQPLSFWTEQDILEYIKTYNIEICSVYGNIVEDNGRLTLTGCQRTGCMWCPLGCHLEKDNYRFIKLAETHPKQYKFCIEGGEWTDNPYYDPNAPEYDGEWKNWNPKRIFVPNNHGVGLGTIFEMCNEIYGKELFKWRI